MVRGLFWKAEQDIVLATIKNILRRGLDLVPATPKPTSTVLVAPRFARTIDEIFHRNEVTP